MKFIASAGQIDMLTLLRDVVVSTLNTDNFGKVKHRQRKFACKFQPSIHRAQILNFDLCSPFLANFPFSHNQKYNNELCRNS